MDTHDVFLVPDEINGKAATLKNLASFFNVDKEIFNEQTDKHESEISKGKKWNFKSYWILFLNHRILF